MNEDIISGPIELSADTFPPGTTVTVKIPLCPECTEDGSNELVRAGFDWKEWTLNEYSQDI